MIADTSTGTTGVTTTGVDSAPASCGDGLVDPGEDCDGGEYCDAQCHEAAFIFAQNVPALYLEPQNAETACFWIVNTTRQYLPYLIDDTLPAPTMPTIGKYSTTCPLQTAQPTAWQTLAELDTVRPGELCSSQGEYLAEWPRIWLTRCIDGRAMLRDADGNDYEQPCSLGPDGDDFNALMICVAQPFEDEL